MKKKLTEFQTLNAKASFDVPPYYTEYHDGETYCVEVYVGYGETLPYCFDTEAERQEFIEEILLQGRKYD